LYWAGERLAVAALPASLLAAPADPDALDPPLADPDDPELAEPELPEPALPDALDPEPLADPVALLVPVVVLEIGTMLAFAGSLVSACTWFAACSD
jgi:hypothetical protein